MAASIVATDLDRTLLDPDSRVTPFSRSVLERASDEGVLLVAATGRSRAAVEHVLVDKRSALEQLARDRGFTAADIVAFGDHRNDLAMLQWVGRGIVMCDGDPAVVAAIQDHTEYGHDKDGVARRIETMLDDGTLRG
ncbi:MAG TPA: HAD hydrolase family protein [Acidimicrobiales bacterium]